MNFSIPLDGATLHHREEDDRWLLDSPEEQGGLQRITGTWDDWVQLAHTILAEDEIRHRQEAGELE